jgi:thioesterase domain-containing protein
MDPRQPQRGPTCLVRVQPRGFQPPLFCVTGGYGDMLALAAIAQQLGDDQPFYGLQPPTDTPLTGGPAETREKLLDHYLAAIRALQPIGPWRIAGYSSGCLIAAALAHALEAKGSVERLLLIDPPGSIPRYEYRGYLSLRGLIRRRYPRPHRRLPRDAKVFHAYFTDEGFACHALAASEYSPPPLRVRATLLLGRRSLLRPFAMRHWPRYTAGNFTVVQVPGGHFSLLREPHSQTLAAAIRAALE